MDAVPLISVVMAVYNAGDDLRQSVPSILGQSVDDFEFIIINDGSKDGRTAEILAEYAAGDARVRVVTQENTGLTIALNRGVALARGKYIARQDADDVSYPDRFARQVAAMEADPALLIVGGNADDVLPDGHRAQWGWHEPEALQRVVFMKTPFPHSTVMMRAETCRKLGGYDETFKTSQDMELWMRFARAGKLGMIREPLIARHITHNSISAKRRWRQFYDALRARWRHNGGLRKLAGVYYSVRGLAIGLLPHGILKAIRTMKAGA